ncbi:MAG: hypothetical protein E6X72_06095 [Clostridioides difficile]|nr:hypothetical protein [Clostridioides difficile]
MSVIESRYVSLYSICRELFEEQGKASKGISFENYYNEQVERFKEILQSLGVNPNSIRNPKDKSFQIPEGKKEYVKGLLREYTSSTMKKVRKKQLPQMPFEEMKPIIENIEDFVNDRLDGKQQTKELTKVYVQSRYVVKEAIEQVRSNAIDKILSDIDGFLPLFIEETLNDVDKSVLLKYYIELLNDASEKWKKVINIASEIREEEIFEQSKKELKNGNINLNVDISDMDALNLKDSNKILRESIEVYEEQEREKITRKYKQPSKQEMNNVKELLEELRGKEIK